MTYSACMEAFRNGQIVFYKGTQRVTIDAIHTYLDEKWSVEISNYPASNYTRNPAIYIGFMGRDQLVSNLSVTPSQPIQS